jgi:hypothetical protein
MKDTHELLVSWGWNPVAAGIACSDATRIWGIHTSQAYDAGYYLPTTSMKFAVEINRRYHQVKGTALKALLKLSCEKLLSAEGSPYALDENGNRKRYYVLRD